MFRSSVTEGFLLFSRPFKEDDTLCELWTEKQGRVRCRISGNPPEPYRQFEIKLSNKAGLPAVSNFRYTQPVLIDSNAARLLGFYVNELLYRLLPAGYGDSSLFGRYISTLLYLNEGENIQPVLRFFEQGVLASLGMAVDYQQDANSLPVVAGQHYRFETGRGFVADAHGRYSGERIIAVNRQDYNLKGALSLARECQRRQIDELLGGGQPILSRQWLVNLIQTKGASEA
ncbi:DNA repair protein RecO [Reinekea marinisedimentorum]|uniref:DNA replication and repair protein RecO n=1 Tax=Reinekea marinisedimentorum TaxID=230495 RepID=A0A4R3I4I6_9GAMM|nr:DNA repair protein RecO C-terminal domain-containing protein [Reinekea marinisedimentorum]TCS39811.1 DNA replication and repair protein RecO [Reinekea marinisedimentorum]